MQRQLKQGMQRQIEQKQIWISKMYEKWKDYRIIEKMVEYKNVITKITN